MGAASLGSSSNCIIAHPTSGHFLDAGTGLGKGQGFYRVRSLK